MHVQRALGAFGDRASYQLVDDSGQAVPEISDFLRHLGARGDSPNTLSAYAYDLLHFTRFLAERGWSYTDFTPARSLSLLERDGTTCLTTRC